MRSGVRVIRKREATSVRPASDVGQLEFLADRLSRLQAAIERELSVARARKERPVYPNGRDPLKLLPEITTLTFNLFYVEVLTAIAAAEEDEQG